MVALQRAASATVRGEGGEAIKDVAFVATSLAEDAAQLARQRVAVARAALSRGMRR
jgi:hypothetical protein